MNNTLQYIINLIIFIPIIIILIVVSIKLSNANLKYLGKERYLRVLERSSLNKDTDVFLLKIGDEGCVIVSSSHKVEKLKELSKEEIELIEQKKYEEKTTLSNLDSNILKKIDLSKFTQIKLKGGDKWKI